MSTLPWQRLVVFGPCGFAAYARLRYLPDPTNAGECENEAGLGDGWWNHNQLGTLVRVLATHTGTPDDCYVCVWEGYGPSDEEPIGRQGPLGQIYADNTQEADTQEPARPALAPGVRRVAPDWPRIIVPNRAYFLFRGLLSDVRNWSGDEIWAGQTPLRAPEPAFVWPVDRAWCIASDVDPHWAGIGADTHVIDQLVTDPRLDVVPADPDAEQPSYR